jgi:hypothetical protein
MEKTELLMCLNFIKMDIKSKMERLFRGKIVFEGQEGLTIKLESDEKVRILLRFTDKRMTVSNIAGSALITLNHITKKQEQTLIAYNKQLQSVSHTIAIIHNYQVLPIAKKEPVENGTIW